MRRIQKHLPATSVARMGERVFVEPAEGGGRNIIPDVRVVERGAPGTSVRTSNGFAVAEPLVVHLEQYEPVRQGFIEIIDIKSGRRVVTVIEILSPSNKTRRSRQGPTSRNRRSLRDGRVSLVEIDLLRTGTRVLSVPFDRIPEGHRTPYAACARRGWKAFEIEFYRIPSANGCRRSHPPPSRRSRRPLDLQALLDRATRTAVWRRHRLPRGARPAARSPDDARWADALLREKGLRG